MQGVLGYGSLGDSKRVLLLGFRVLTGYSDKAGDHERFAESPRLAAE